MLESDESKDKQTQVTSGLLIALGRNRYRGRQSWYVHIVTDTVRGRYQFRPGGEALIVVSHQGHQPDATKV